MHNILKLDVYFRSLQIPPVDIHRNSAANSRNRQSGFASMRLDDVKVMKRGTAKYGLRHCSRHEKDDIRHK